MLKQKEIKQLCKLLKVDPFELDVLLKFIDFIKIDRTYKNQLIIKSFFESITNNSIIKKIDPMDGLI